MTTSAVPKGPESVVAPSCPRCPYCDDYQPPAMWQANGIHDCSCCGWRFRVANLGDDRWKTERMKQDD